MTYEKKGEQTMMTINSITVLDEQRPAPFGKHYPSAAKNKPFGLQAGFWCANHISN